MTSRFTKALVMTALAAGGVVVWTGCDSETNERSYCDNTGCYTCDAYGCSNTSAGPTTQTGFDAGTNTIPTTGADGGGNTTPGCGTGPACASPEVCVTGVCTAPQNACKFTSDCGDVTKVCADGACLTACKPDNTCDGDFTCTKGVCQPNAPSPDAGTQPTGCTSDTACGAGKYCNNSTCVVDTRPKPNCAIDTDCGGSTATPKVCQAGYCKYTCSSDQYCRTIDSRIGTCASDGVCRSSKEATAQCTGPGSCPLSGQSCIDNACK